MIIIIIIIYTRATEETTVVRWKVLREHNFTLTVFVYLSDWLSDWMSEWVFVSFYSHAFGVCAYVLSNRVYRSMQMFCIATTTNSQKYSAWHRILIWAFDFTSSLFLFLSLVSSVFFFVVLSIYLVLTNNVRSS